MATPNIVPRSDSEGGLGTASKYWASAYIDTINATVIQSPLTDGDLILKADNGSGTMTAYLTLDGGNTRIFVEQHMQFNDNKKIRLGSGADLELYHDGTHSYLENGTGSLFIRNSTNDTDIIFQSDSGNGGIATYFSLDGSEAAHDGSATTALYTNWPDKSRISLGTSHDLIISHDGSHSYIQQANTGNLYIQNGVNDGDIILSSDDGSGGQTAYITLDGGDELVKAGKSLRIPDSGQVLGSGSGEIQLGNTNSGIIKVGGDSDNSTISSAFNNLVLQSTRDQDDVIIKGGAGADVYITLDCGDISTTINTIKVLMPNLPTSASSLATGQLYNDSGTLKIA